MSESNNFLYGFLESIEKDDRSLMEDFHESTKLTPNGSKQVIKRIGAFLHVNSIRHLVTGAWKNYQGYPSIELPPADLKEVTLADALKNRRSLSSVARSFDDESITKEQLATILGASYGITGNIEPRTPSDPTQPLRAIASAGALYPCEIYACVFNVDGIEQGLYHYNVKDHTLTQLINDEVKVPFFECISGGEQWEGAAVMLVLGVVIDRSVSKYMERGYRFAMHDCGALLQNIHLTTTAVGLIGCTNGGFYDQRLGNWLKMDNINEFPAITFGIGKA